MFAEPSDREALRFGEKSLNYAELHQAAGTLAERLKGHTRVAVWATSTLETCVSVVAGLLAGVAIVPLNPKLGERELEHILGDSRPDLILRDETVRLVSDPAEPGRDETSRLGEPHPETPALVIYTSGTTGPPKGVVLPRRSLTSNIDALAKAWQWTSDDVLVHGLPLFHVHGLGIGILGPLRLGGAVRHVKFSPEAIGHEFATGATMMFGVPTMYHRIAEAVENDATLADQFRTARLLVSGSAALPASDHERIAKATGQGIVERYGMSETLMNVSVRFDGDRRPGAVGLPVDGVDVQVVDEQGDGVDDGAIGEIEVRGPNLFLEYLNRPDATEAAFRDGWFRTGDMAVRDPDGYIRIVGRRATDLIKSGGYKIGAGEIENVLLEHPSVAEVAVTGEPDDDLGERIVAWVVPAGEAPEPSALSDHVAKLLSPHKRPRVVRYLQALPRNEMGKVLKRELS
ncbi:acyl-CoA synthetase [Lentzea sp. BCCO 10_0061]|uniref:Acyl-CoA synthetase n=1 Tax=Lentzea sokolovensis TaxID=3095429 RepID=A0ABU4USZ7_9PSEU|nr:acyl-CoA synthetase [Lentzea sp. BCCO 10_0061]MDX8142633.1 acyl-CoA synthetase [Lentzea sp. BCCO 10_0061]